MVATSKPGWNPTARGWRVVAAAGLVFAHIGPIQGSAVEANARGGGSTETWRAVQRALNTTCQHDSECRSLGLGYRGCGGPQQYLAWSTVGTDEAALKAAAARHDRSTAKEALAHGEMSTCQLLPDPGARCVRPLGAAPGATGRCELRPLSGGRSSDLR